ncbi:hypothetical protein [Streptacidiphilus carbonis]|uniref:hypothetical protein n=1 Tax=Streptacidiphilus carbonis TaxID=105422 RepID=UPI0005A5E07F|nr:hypothetical protein [Streptacidiphilus carbonis]
MASLASEQLTAEQARARVEQARRAGLRERMHVELTDAEFDATPGALDRVYEIAAAKARDALRGAA